MKKDQKQLSSTYDELFEHVKKLKLKAKNLIKANKFKDTISIIDELLKLDDQQLLSSNPSAVKELVDIARILFPTKDFIRLEKLFIKGLGILDKHKQVKRSEIIIPLNNLMALYDQQGNPDALNQIATLIIANAEQLTDPIDFNTSEVFHYLGDIYAKADNPKVACILYKQVQRFMEMNISNLPTSIYRNWLIKYANTMAIIGENDEAIKHYEQVLNLLSDKSTEDNLKRIELLCAIGNCQSSKNDKEKAEQSFKQAISIAKESDLTSSKAVGTVYHNLASLYVSQYNTEKYNDAEEFMKRAIAITIQAGKKKSAEYAGGLAQLAVIYTQKGNFDKAQELYKESFDVYENASDTNIGEFSDFLIDAGILNMKYNKDQEAVKSFQRAWELRESSPNETPERRIDALSDLATAYFKVNELSKAIELYTHAIDLRHQMQETHRV